MVPEGDGAPGGPSRSRPRSPPRTPPAIHGGDGGLRPPPPRNGPPPAVVGSLAVALLVASFLGGGAEATPHDFGGEQEDNWRITCYTCMNVSNNEECNRYAIDRPCPQGRDYCLTLHVMDGLELDRSVLVNKRCAYLDECTGDSTGCATLDGQTQCVSCCDQPYCNDFVPSNETSAMFHRSSASGSLVIGPVGRTWRLAVLFSSAILASRCHVVS
ncbi:uncharacterized protein [Hetaerina americana]|uniref:uncharacterized protein isoform X1 n=1 Tax=Hetaerina americana TaxID=62018 RepID=UPI003A7F47A5